MWSLMWSIRWCLTLLEFPKLTQLDFTRHDLALTQLARALKKTQVRIEAANINCKAISHWLHKPSWIFMDWGSCWPQKKIPQINIYWFVYLRHVNGNLISSWVFVVVRNRIKMEILYPLSFYFALKECTYFDEFRIESRQPWRQSSWTNSLAEWINEWLSGRTTARAR